MGTALGTDLATKRDQLLAATQRLSAPLELSAFLVRGEPVAFAEASRGRYAPFHVGESWGPPWSTTWFHVRGRVPSEWSDQNVVAVFDIGFEGRHTGFTCEALAWLDGRPWRGVDPNHRWLPITSPDVDFYLEASAIPTAVVSGPADAPSMIALRESAAKAFVFRQAELRVQDPAARKMALDFKALYDLAGALPDGHRCAGSEPAQYAWMKESYPDVFQRIRQKVTAGQWEPVGSMWVEADCNLPSGEALVRQFLQGKRFFMQEFGVDTRELWLPDVFGYPASLPQLIAESGGEYFLTQKLSWNDTNKPAHQTF